MHTTQERKTGKKKPVQVVAPRATNNRVTVAWLPDNKNPENAVGFMGRLPIFPSKPDQNPPSNNCIGRKEPCVPGYAEDCVIFLQHGGKAYVAYPASNGTITRLPGIDEPLMVEWGKNVRDENEMISQFTLTDGITYFRIFKGDDGTINKSPVGILTKRWYSEPTGGSKSLVWINWITANGKPIGYAYQHIENNAIEQSCSLYLQQYHVNTDNDDRLTVIADKKEDIEDVRSIMVNGSIFIIVNLKSNEVVPIGTQRYGENFYIKGPAGMITIIPKWRISQKCIMSVIQAGNEIWICIYDEIV